MSGVDIVADDAEPVVDQAEQEARDRAEALAEADRREKAKDEDFGEFWGQLGRKGTVLRNVFGVDVTLPPALPLSFEVMAREVKESKDPETTKRLVGTLYGPAALDHWVASGMDLEQFSVMLMWGTSNTRSPGSMTLAEAHAIYKDNSGGQGKDPASKATETGSGGPSSGTGPRSKPTSAGSTGSRKKKSRR